MFQLSTLQTSVQDTPRGPQLTLDFPAAGLWQAGRGVWLGVLACGWLMLAAIAIPTAIAQGPVVGLAPVAVFGSLGLIAIWWLLTFLGRAPARITVIGDELAVSEVNLFRTRRGLFRANELRSVTIGKSRISGGEDCPPLPELKIECRNGRHFTLLRGRNQPLLEETVATLQRALRL